MLGFFKKLFSAEMYEVEPEPTGEASPASTIEESAAGGEATSENVPGRALVLSRQRVRQPVPLKERQAA